ncbi:Glycosyltransferase involved in cell wall bisynthesis [Paenibacillaceae bacterium GAS479]|nr:Glycosyltransferase involved in cell wall bisynthesis [Paenibacillaceae bacterium GAS479]
MENIKIAFCGTRGIPAAYGGFETAVDEITKKIIVQNQGTDCYIFCRSHSGKIIEDDFEGRKRIFIKGSDNRKLDTFLSSINTGLYLLKNRKKFDYVFWFNNANFFGILLTKIAGIPMAINTDGLEWRRAKWSLPFKAFYFLSSFLICLICRNLISDSISIQTYYKKRFFKKTKFIPYGSVNIPNEFDLSDQMSILAKHGVEYGKFYLQITRFEPDNLPLAIVKAFSETNLYKEGYKFILIGYKDSTKYSQEIMKLHNQSGVYIFPANYNIKELHILRKSAYCYVHGNSVGGTNPALLEAMISCKRVMAIDGPFSKEVLGPQLGNYFKETTLKEDFLKSQLMNDQSLGMSIRIKEKYNWDEVSLAYLSLAERSKVQNNYSKNIKGDFLELD